ncbi:MAG: hypothetical protein LBU67_04580 [Oscillospiraceae bacterium]|nr:hypothetical protein [Oscillospiraceae bacterium]
MVDAAVEERTLSATKVNSLRDERHKKDARYNGQYSGFGSVTHDCAHGEYHCSADQKSCDVCHERSMKRFVNCNFYFIDAFHKKGRKTRLVERLKPFLRGR